MWIRQGRLRSLLTSLLAAAALPACNSPEDVGHRIYGYVDAQGSVVIAPAYLDALPFHEGLAAVRAAAGWGFIDAQGHWVIPARYLAAGSFANGRALVKDPSGLWGYLDRSGRAVIAPQYESASAFLGDRAYVMRPDDRVQLIDRDGRVVSESNSTGRDWSDAFGDEPSLSVKSYWGVNCRRFLVAEHEAIRREGLVPLKFEGSDDEERSGYVDLRGMRVIEPGFDEANPFVDGRALVKKDGKYGFIDRTGQVVVPLEFDDLLLRFSRDRTVAVRDKHAWLIDTTGRQVADLGVWPWPELGKDDEFATLSFHIGFSDFFADGLIPWQQGGRWGYVGLDGHWIIEPRYDSAQPFHGGTASVQRDGQGFLIDTSGHELVPAAAGWIGPRDGLLTRAGTATRWGFVGQDGKFPVELPFAASRIQFAGRRFADAQPLQFSEGLALVSRIAPHRWLLVDARGRTRAEGRFEWLEQAGPAIYAFGEDQRWGLADANLHVLSPARFDAKPEFVGSEASAFAVQGGRSGCVDRRGRWTPLPSHVDNASCSEPLMTADTATGTGVLGMDGRWRISPEFTDVTRLTGTDEPCFQLSKDESPKPAKVRVACVSKQGVRYSETGEFRCYSGPPCMMRVGQQWQRLDLKSMQRQGAGYDEFWNLLDYPRSGLLVRQGKQWGLLAASGKLALPVRYEALTPAGTGFLAMRVGAKWGIIDINGHTVVAPRFERIQAVRHGLMLVKEEGRYSLVTVTGKAVLEPVPDWMQRIGALADFSDRFWAVHTTDRELYFIDKRTLATHELKPPAGYAWVQWVKPGEFTMTEFGGVTCVDPVGAQPRPDSVRRHCVVIDANGRQVPPLFESAVQHGSRFTVTVQGKCGVLDDQGRWIAAMRHDHCDDGDRSQRIVVGDEDY